MYPRDGDTESPSNQGFDTLLSTDADTVIAVLLTEDLTSKAPAAPLPVMQYEFVIVDPVQGDMHGETFIIRDTSISKAAERATARVKWLASRLEANLFGIAPTGMVRT